MRLRLRVAHVVAVGSLTIGAACANIAGLTDYEILSGEDDAGDSSVTADGRVPDDVTTVSTDAASDRGQIEDARIGNDGPVVTDGGVEDVTTYVDTYVPASGSPGVKCGGSTVCNSPAEKCCYGGNGECRPSGNNCSQNYGSTFCDDPRDCESSDAGKICCVTLLIPIGYTGATCRNECQTAYNFPLCVTNDDCDSGTTCEAINSNFMPPTAKFCQ